METSKEELAALCHKQWVHWMEDLLSQCETGPACTLLIPTKKLKRWKRQMETDYEDLSDKEKASNREMAEQFLSTNAL